jgi:hypothetical protein
MEAAVALAGDFSKGQKGTDMRTRLRLSNLAAVVAMIGSLATTGASTAVAQENTALDQAARACGGGVFLDGIRALDVLEEGNRDEVYILNQSRVKIWPTTADDVSMAEGQRVEVDKCVPVGPTLRLWDDDGPANPDDVVGIVTIFSQSTVDKYTGAAHHTPFPPGGSPQVDGCCCPPRQADHPAVPRRRPVVTMETPGRRHADARGRTCWNLAMAGRRTAS